jgi:hypothetical protein
MIHAPCPVRGVGIRRACRENMKKSWSSWTSNVRALTKTTPQPQVCKVWWNHYRSIKASWIAVLLLLSSIRAYTMTALVFSYNDMDEQAWSKFPLCPSLNFEFIESDSQLLLSLRDDLVMNVTSRLPLDEALTHASSPKLFLRKQPVQWNLYSVNIEIFFVRHCLVHI